MSAVLLTKLIEALQCLPGVGPKSAQRMTYHLLERDRDAALHLAEMLQAAVKHIGHCKSCRNFSETELCTICSDVKRERSVICIVESPADVAAIEHATDYRGLYFVLMGHLSPLDGIGPAEIGLQQLETQLAAARVEEIILATNTTVEGEATAHYIADMVRGRDIKVSRIAHGVPMGGELEFVNSSTLHHAFLGRRSL